MKIGVELRLVGDAAELYADARALETAGADSLWVRGSLSFDPWALLSALGAVTWRVRLVVFDLPEVRTVARDTVENLSRGRLVPASGQRDAFTIGGVEGADERWSLVEFPQGRAAWKELRARHEAEGTTGLVLQNDPRLLDLIRNPDVEDDRQDLKLAFG
jgi:alkanesulfonate monooxygenase SsuD/methylene tetrahydromethanopterin reductase-like flavin-dependent oxidoreductase (luciferase family)